MSSRPPAPRTMDINEILQLLPHRHPFLLVDRVLDLVPGVRAVGLKTVTMNEPYFEGHFPGHPVMPAVMITEAMAQVAGILLLSISGHEGKLAYFTGIDKQKFRRPVRPGDILVMSISMIAIKGYIGKVRASAYVFRLESATLEEPEDGVLPRVAPSNGVGFILAEGSDEAGESQPARKVLMGSMEGEIAAEGELMFALVDKAGLGEGP